MCDFINLIKKGLELAENVGTLALDVAKAAVLGYFTQVKKWSARLFMAALIPLLVIVPSLMLHQPFAWLYGAYVFYFVLLAAAELALIFPVFLVWKRVKNAFPSVARDLHEWVDFIKSVVFNGLSFGIFVTLFPVWRSPGALPLLLVVVACWLTLPLCSVSSFCKRVFPAVRAVQLIFLFGLLVLEMIFPLHMEQVQWEIERKIGLIITRPITQQEITSQWRDLLWYDNQGKPKVWYSGSPDATYKLWTAPGFDPTSGQELQPVTDDNKRRQIVDNLAEFERKLREIAAVNEAKMHRMEEELTAKQIAEKTKRAAAEQTEIDRKQEKGRRREEEEAATAELSYLAKYLGADPIPKVHKGHTLAVVVASEKERLNNDAARAISSLLRTEVAVPISSLFTHAFVTDGLFTETFLGSSIALTRLQITNRVEMLLLVRQSVVYSTNASLEGIITANMKFELLGFPSSSQTKSVGRTIVSSGVGFRSEDARSLAEERAMGQLKAGEADALLRDLISMAN